MTFHGITWWLTVLLVGSLSVSGMAAQTDDDGAGYRLGQGMAVGDTGFTLGGYGSVESQTLDRDEPRAALSHVSLFLWWESQGGFKFFSELDNQETQGSADIDQDGRRYLSVERLYVDYSFNDALTLRAGKFLTPIGQWNQIHADPLVWTTSRPLLTDGFFPDNVSGLMATGNVNLAGHQADYTVYLSASSEVRSAPTQTPFGRASGFRGSVALSDNLTAGLSAASFNRNTDGDVRQQLVGADFQWASHGYELSGEAVRRRSNLASARQARASFVQAVLPLEHRFSAVGRWETVNEPAHLGRQQRAVLGVVYRGSRALSLKLETVRDFGSSDRANGMLASASVLF